MPVPLAVSSGFKRFQCEDVTRELMTFVDDVAALRRLLGVAMHLEFQPAILAMSLAMGLEGGGSLPDQVAVSGGFAVS